jgi:hypothetical protein
MSRVTNTDAGDTNSSSATSTDTSVLTESGNAINGSYTDTVSDTTTVHDSDTNTDAGDTNTSTATSTDTSVLTVHDFGRLGQNTRFSCSSGAALSSRSARIDRWHVGTRGNRWCST